MPFRAKFDGRYPTGLVKRGKRVRYSVCARDSLGEPLRTFLKSIRQDEPRTIMDYNVRPRPDSSDDSSDGDGTSMDIDSGTPVKPQQRRRTTSDSDNDGDSDNERQNGEEGEAGAEAQQRSPRHLERIGDYLGHMVKIEEGAQNIVERSKYIPLRLSDAERELLQILHGALEITEYVQILIVKDVIVLSFGAASTTDSQVLNSKTS